MKTICPKCIAPPSIKPAFLLILACLLSVQAKAQLFQDHTPLLTAQAVSNTAIELAWVDDFAGITGFYVEVPSGVGGGWTAIQWCGPATRNFVVQNL
ncbi:MAG TPA: hypothetical protein VIO38_05160, partial [Rariglobus sp.]